MKALNAGDKVTIGGKEYTIGGEEADVTAMLEKANITATAGDKVSINGKEYTYYAAIDADTTGAGYKGTAAGFYAVDPATLDNKTKATTADYAGLDAIKALKGATIKAGTHSVTTIDDTNKNGAKAGDGIDATDTSVITKAKAYELASKELLAANQIGDTEGNAKVGKVRLLHTLLMQSLMQLQRYLSSVPHLVPFRTVWSTPSTTWITLLRTPLPLSLVSVIQTWLKRWLTTQRTASFSRLVSLCSHRLIRQTRVYCHFFSNSRRSFEYAA